MPEYSLETPQRHNIATHGIDWGKPLVSIRCFAYNQEAYIKDALEGFVMQETTFPFEAIVHDDASTDGTATIIREYAEKYPHIIKPIFQTENQYSKHDGSLGRAVDEVISKESKYWALCEGDDYWTDPLKLQKQVVFMDKHNDFSMCFHNFSFLRNGKLFQSYEDYPIDNQEVFFSDIVKHGGWVFTGSRLFRAEYQNQIQELTSNCCVGDYPQALALAICGRVFYMKDNMCIYRQGQLGSWMTNFRKENTYKRRIISRNIVEMLERANKISKGRYKYSIYKAEYEQFLNCRDWEKLGKLKFYSIIKDKPIGIRVRYGLSLLQLHRVINIIDSLRIKRQDALC